MRAAPHKSLQEALSVQQAYVAAERFAQQHAKTFQYASMLLPPKRRQAMRVAYAFFRRMDDMVDQARVSPSEFHNWREQAMRPVLEQTDPILMAWADVRDRFAVNPAHVQELLNGIEIDLHPRRYETLKELQGYCYQIASTVGLLSLPILGLALGASLEQAEPYAAQLCIALQLTNILRDVSEDLEQGRIYLPNAELSAFGLSYTDIEDRQYDDRFKSLIAHLIRYTRRLYAESWPGIRLLSLTGRLIVGFGSFYYLAILDEIERLDFDVFTHQIHFSLPRKLWFLCTKWPAILWPQIANKSFI